MSLSVSLSHAQAGALLDASVRNHTPRYLIFFSDFANYSPSSGITWLNTPYNFDVQPGTKSGFSVGFVKAEKSGATLFYTIASDPQDLFLIDFITGELTLQNDIDERQTALGTNQFCSSFFAFSGSSQSQIGVGLHRAVNTNLNTPTFTNSSYNLVLPEDQSLGTVVFRVDANDTDTGEDGRLTYSVTNGNANGTFSLNATSGGLSLRKHLDYEERKTFMLSLSATDNGRAPRTGSATINVTVTDVNDNVPYFLQPTYSVAVLENATVGSEILAVSARDADSGSNAILTYSLQTMIPEFSINSVSGVLLLSQSLDYERKRSYTVRVNVTDSKHSSQASVFITVINVDECHLATCHNGGTCFEGDANYTCICASGFTDERCETNINECSSHPCQNNGTCLDGVDTFICSCLPGLSGLYCQINIDDCQLSSCHNGGTCTDIINGYVCECPPGFTGVSCAANIDECSSMPCMNQGKCADGTATYNCSCLDGYTGIHCETNIDECLSKPCRHGATCLDEVNHYTCVCAPGYTGLHCETDFDECSSEPCFHNSTCIDDINSYRCSCRCGFAGAQCQCSLGFTGEACATNIDECSSMPCMNQGKCVDGIAAYKCSCLDGYTGTHCETNIDECLSKPCRHGATCLDEVNHYACVCASGYTGLHCETNYDECSSEPCLHNSTCIDGINAYQCSCRIGYTGAQCEVDVDECQSSPCQNGGTCTDIVNGYHCSCSSDFSGGICDVNIIALQSVGEVNGNCKLFSRSIRQI